MNTSTTLASELSTARSKSTRLPVTLLTGGFDKPYAYGMSIALASHGVRLEVIGSDEVDSPEMHSRDAIEFLNWQQGWRHDVSAFQKITRLLGFYLRLAIYALRTNSRLFHILWNNKFVYFDRTVLMLYFRMLGKRITLTAHNVNTAKRDRSDSWLNRVTLKVQYRLGQPHIRTYQKDADRPDFRVRRPSGSRHRHPVRY